MLAALVTIAFVILIAVLGVLALRQEKRRLDIEYWEIVGKTEKKLYHLR